jgi:hypothetical protein
MTSSSTGRKRGSDRGDYGFARARDLAFDAVTELWRKRRAAGTKQSDIAAILNRDPGWVSRQLSGPGNWTLRTFGELVEALDGEAEISVHPIEEAPADRTNYHAYLEYQPTLGGTPKEVTTSSPFGPQLPINKAARP